MTRGCPRRSLSGSAFALPTEWRESNQSNRTHTVGSRLLDAGLVFLCAHGERKDVVPAGHLVAPVERDRTRAPILMFV